MKTRNLNLKGIIFHLRIRFHLVIFLLSLVFLIFIILKFINFNLITNLSQIFFLDWIFQLLVFISTGFTLLFLPCYPLLFIIFKDIKLNLLEKVTITFVLNLSYYVIIGIFGYYLGYALTEWFFFIVLVTSYFLIMLYIVIVDLRTNKFNFFKQEYSHDYKESFFKNFSILNYLKKSRISNSVLLAFLIFLISILSIFGASLFIGTDPWMHISIIKYIININYLPLNDYFGTFGFHIFGALINYFSGISIILIPKFFIFYTFPLISLIVYNLFMRIFRNKNLAILGIFILSISSLGFLNILFQFWPTSLALIQGITLFFLLYVRLQSFIKEKEPTKKQIFSDIYLFYVFFIIIFISCLLIHSLIAMIFLVSYLWMYLIYFVKSYHRGNDIILLGICLCIFFIFYFLNISTGHFIVFNKIGGIPWYYTVSVMIIICILEGLILLHYRKSMIFTKGLYSLVIMGKIHKNLKKIEDKFLIPVVFIIVTIFISIFTILNLFFFKFELTTIFTGIEILIICLFGIWGLFIFQFKPRGKPLLLWGLALGIILLIGFLFDFLTSSLTFFSRIFYLSSIIISIGFTSYIYKLVKTRSVQKPKIQFFMIFLTIFSLLATYFEIYFAIDFYSLKNREISTIKWYSNYNSNKNGVIAEFGWEPVFIFFGYPFEDNNRSIPLSDVINFYMVSNDYLNPKRHIQNGSNILVNLKKNSGTEIFLIVTDYYLLLSGLELFGRLSNEEIEMYYNISYLNKVCSSKTEDSNEIPMYWVI